MKTKDAVHEVATCICGRMRFPKLPEIELPNGALKCVNCPKVISLAPGKEFTRAQ